MEPGPGENVIVPDEIDTSHVQLEEEPAPAPAVAHTEARAALDEKEMINQEIIRALRDHLDNPIFPILIVRIFNLGGALYDAGLDADMPPAHRLIIGGVVLVVVIGLTNPDVIENMIRKWKRVTKTAPAPGLPAAAPKPIDIKGEVKPDAS